MVAPSDRPFQSRLFFVKSAEVWEGRVPVKLEELVSQVQPNRTVLLFGAGSSIPSGAPSVDDLVAHFSSRFSLPRGFRLSELASLAEEKTSRAVVIAELRKFFLDLKPIGGIKSIPNYDWKSIYTTNYDTLIEQSYQLKSKICGVYSSNFDFTIGDANVDCRLFKLHGTIEKDESDGHRSKIILSEADYEHTEQYREYLYDRLKGDLAGADLLIIGHSLADQDLDIIIRRAIKINSQILAPSKLSILLYTHDEYRAHLLEQRGLRVTFGAIDDFFEKLAETYVRVPPLPFDSDDPVSRNPKLAFATLDVAQHSDPGGADISAMFNGWPAAYSDIQAGLTFERNIAREVADYFETEGSLCAVLIGAAGVGKSTAARQSLQLMRMAGFRCWEHKVDHTLNIEGWLNVARSLSSNGFVGALFVDDAHMHLLTLNDLVDRLTADNNAHLKIVAASTKNHWYPRIKTPNFYKHGQEFKLSKLSQEEIERLLNLIERQPEVRELVEETFSGFNRQERRRRLIDRCQADMFACLRNIFAVEAFDDIILREYATLHPREQEIYRHVAAMETAGVRVHRQLVIRMLGIVAEDVKPILNYLEDIVQEYSIDETIGIYGWKCRHPIISGIITKFKFKDIDETIALFEKVIDKISPSYEIEIRTIRDLCNLDGGLARIPDKAIQNRLLRKIISHAPGERVPRHRLIRNLIDQGAFEKADTEIRVFNHDFGSDGPVHRYKIRLMIARAVHTPGILEEDRIAILEQARELAVIGVERYPYNKNILTAYAELGIEYFRRTGSYEFFDEAINQLKLAEDRLGDPDISATISRFERRIAGQTHAADMEPAVEDG